MARPIEATPTLYGEDATAFIENAERVARGELTQAERESSFQELARGLDFFRKIASVKPSNQ